MNKLFKTEIVDPFNFSRLYGNEKYSLDAMEMKAVNFPFEVDPNKITAVWSDRIITAWWEAAQKIESIYTGDAFFGGATNESFLRFAQEIAKAINFKHEVTGARVTRYTNRASGYPVFVLEVTNGGKGIRHPKQPQPHFRRFRDGFDGYYYANESNESDGVDW